MTPCKSTSGRKRGDAEYSSYDHERNQAIIYDSLHLGIKGSNSKCHQIGYMRHYVVCGRHYFTHGVVRLSRERGMFCNANGDVVEA